MKKLAISRKAQTVLLATICMWQITANAQSIREKTLSSAHQAQEMAADDNWDEAIKHLETSINNLGPGSQEASYRSYLYFNQGYLYERRPQPDTSEYLKRAQRSYLLALRERPGYAKATNNLILVSKRLKDYDTALKYIEVIKKSDSANTYKWDLLAGEIYLEQKNVKGAWTVYSKAVEADYNNREAALKLIDIYHAMPPENGNKLIAQCKKFKSHGKAEIARLGFEEILRMNCDSKSTYFEEALLGWCGVVASSNWVRPRLINDIAGLSCKVPALTRLEKNIVNTWELSLDGTWWSENDRRRFYYLALQKSWADHLLSKGEKKDAMQLYLATRSDARKIRDVSKEIYGRNNVLEMESVVQLARLYSDKKLNPRGDNFTRLERELFAGKGGAYQRGDLPDIQKFHTVLALIYVERGQWQGGYAQNATFQLEHAIATAKKRSRSDAGAYRPLPHLHRYLATAYLKSKRLEKAADANLNAAIDYLETDNLRLSQQMIRKSDSLNQYIKKGAILSKQAGVKAIYQARTQIQELNAGAFETNNTNYYRGTSTYNWLDKPNLIKGIDSKVVERQKFKTVSDLSIRAKKVGALNASGNLKNEAKINSRQVGVLSSQQDVIRLKKIDVSNNLTNYKDLQNNRQLRQDLKTGDKIYSPEQSNQIQRVIITNDKINN